MKTILAVIVFLIAVSAPGQEKRNENVKLKIGFTISPDTYFEPKSITLTDVTGLGQVESSGFSFTSGIIAVYSLNQKFDIVSGINYSNRDYSARYYCTVCEFVTIPPVEPIKARFLEVPFLMRYNILNKQFGIHVEAGFSGSFLLNQMNTSYTGKLQTNVIQFGGLAGLGINYDLGRRVNIFVTSDFRKSFTNLIKDSDFKYKSLGFTTGISYRFN